MSASHFFPLAARVCSLPLVNFRNDCIPELPERDHFFFNAEHQECELFHFFNCQGNNNDFATREACENLCLPHATTQPSAAESSTPVQLLTTEDSTHSPETVYPQPSTTGGATTVDFTTVQVQESTMTQVQDLTTSVQEFTTTTAQELTQDSTTVQQLLTTKRQTIYAEVIIVTAVLLVVVIVVAIALGAVVLWRRNKIRLTVIM